MKKIWISLAVIAVFLVFTGCTNEDTSKAGEQLETVRVAVMTNNITQWVATVGEKQGIFAENGINLEISEFAAGINTADAVAIGQADIGNMADYALVNRIGSVENSTLQVLASTQVSKEGSGGTALYVNPQKIKIPADLANNKLGTVKGTVNDYYLEKTYTYAGVSEEEQNVVFVSDFAAAVAAAQSDQIDALWAFGTDAEKLTAAGFEPLMTLSELNIFTNAYLFSTADYLKNNENTAISYLKAYQETIDWILANKQAAAEIIEEESNTPQAVFLESLEAQDYRLALKQTDTDTIYQLAEWEYQNGNFDHEYDVYNFINAEPLKTAFPEAVDFSQVN